MDTQRNTSRMTRVVTQSSLGIGIVILIVLSFVGPQPYQFLFVAAAELIIGLLMVFGGLFNQSRFADAIGIGGNTRISRSRGFYITFGFIFIAVTIATLLTNFH
jgi:uncharacterized membrane protein YecN with MAPEG domain